MIEIQNVKLPRLFLLLVIMLAFVSLPVGKVRAQNPPTVNVSVEGELLVMPVAPVIIEDRTMVPVRFVTEAVQGAVEWDPVLRQVTVTRYSDTIVLAVGKKEAVVNGQVVGLEVAPQIVADRTMVPLRFIVEALGGTVEWDPDTRTVNILRRPADITAMTYTPGTGKSMVTLLLSEPLLHMQPAVAANTVDLELYPARIALDQPDRQVMDALLNALHLKADGRTVHFEARLWNKPSYRYSVSPDGKLLTLEFDHTVAGFQSRQEGRISVLTVNTTGSLEYTAFPLANPPRLVLDVKGALTEGLPDKVMIANDPYVSQVRSAMGQPGITRIVLDMKTSVPPFDVVPTDLGLQVRFVPRILAVTTEQRQGITRLTLDGSLPVDATVTAVPAERQLVITVPQAVSGLAENLIKVADGTVNTITVAPGTGGGPTVVTVDLPYYLGHTVVSKPGDSDVVVDLVTSPVYGRRIWIDAGHGKIPGGKDDPGTIGRTFRTYEKNVNLAIALELQERLQAAGAIVFMTRTGDAGVDFTERPALVNSTQPAVDLFVSIHHNSAAASTVRGIETYYWTTNPKSKAAATAIHAAVLKGLGFPDRRVRTEAFVVIKDTKAPSVLVELGYLSSPEEETEIISKAYPGRAAEALVNGIFIYFWQEIR
jgi:N-acetylmuramoyl-L-alanine amidase